MKLRVWVWMGMVAMVGAVGACGDDDKGTPDATAVTEVAVETEVAEPDTQVETTAPETEVSQPDAEVVEEVAAETSEPEVIEEVQAEVTPALVTWDDVYPIFASSCTPCHNRATPDGGSGGHSIASTDKAVAYAASQLDADVCPGKKIGECALIRVQNGSMPASGDCQNPIGEKCPDAAEQALIQQWIDQGMLGPRE